MFLLYFTRKVKIIGMISKEQAEMEQQEIFLMLPNPLMTSNKSKQP